MVYNIIAIIILLVFVLGTIITDKRVRISTIMGIMWAFLLTVSHAYYSEAQLPLSGIVYIVAACVVFLITDVVSSNIVVITRINPETLTNSSRLVNNVNFIAFFAICGSLFLLAYTLYSGITIAGISGIAGSTYHAEIEGNIFAKITNAFCFSFISLDGFALFHQKYMDYREGVTDQKYKTYIIPILVVQLLIATVSSQKSPIIWSAIFWAAGLITGVETFVSKQEQRKIIGVIIKKYYRILILLLISFIAALLLLFFVRHRESLSTILDRFMVYGFCEVPVFSIWFDNISANTLQHSMGGQTIYGIVRLLGAGDNLSINWALDNNAIALGAHSNIFTAFRGLIEDFGVRGSLICWCVLGLIAGQAERETAKSIVKIGLINMIVVFVFFTFLISAWHYTTVFIACVMFFFELVFVNCVYNDYPNR